MNNDAYNNFINQDFSRLADFIYCFNGYEATILATLIGLIIAPSLSINEQNTLGNFFEQLGQTLLTIAAQNQTVKHKRKQVSAMSNDKVTDLEEEIYRIKQELYQLRKDALMNDNI